MRKLVIAVDFDNTIVSEEYPLVGELIPGAKETINWLHGLGHTIIIWTCREGMYADDAVDCLIDNEIHFDFYNKNQPERVDHYGNDSRKIGCDILIDDRCILSKMIGDRVDWEMVRDAFETLFEIYE